MILYRHEQPNPNSHNTMRVWIRLPMSVHLQKFISFKLDEESISPLAVRLLWRLRRMTLLGSVLSPLTYQEMVGAGKDWEVEQLTVMFSSRE